MAHILNHLDTPDRNLRTLVYSIGSYGFIKRARVRTNAAVGIMFFLRTVDNMFYIIRDVACAFHARYPPRVRYSANSTRPSRLS